MKRIFDVFVVATLAMTSLQFAQADELGDSRFDVRGFGTLGATTHGTDGVEFRRARVVSERTIQRVLDMIGSR